jgi:hypothetical protein
LRKLRDEKAWPGGDLAASCSGPEGAPDPFLKASNAKMGPQRAYPDGSRATFLTRATAVRQSRAILRTDAAIPTFPRPWRTSGVTLSTAPLDRMRSNAEASGGPLRASATGAVAALGAAALPGVLAGAHLTGLLFFLNPELPWQAAPLLRGIVVYGSVLGALSLLLHLPALRRGRLARALPWSLTAVLLAIAVLDAAQASWYAFYLPSGVNTRLLKAATGLAATGLAALFTALAHTFPARRYGRRSRIGLVVLALGSLYLIVERREAAQPRPEATPLRSVVEGQRPLALYVVGIDSATLDAILPLAEQGRLPFFASLLAEGSYARLRSLTPTRDRPLWTTMATGKYPHRHGVRDDLVYPAAFLSAETRLRLLPVGVGFSRWGLFGQRRRAAATGERRALALWQILPRLQVPTGVVGWPEALPAEPGTSFSLPDTFFGGSPDAKTTTWPAELAERAALFEVGVEQIDPSLLEGFGDPAPPLAANALAGDLWRESLTFYLLGENPQTRAVFLRLPGLRRISRRWFGGYAAVQHAGEPGPRAATAARLVEQYYRHLDDYLAQLWRRTDGPRLLAVVSPYGAAPPGPWSRALRLGRLPIEGVLGGSADGALLLRGDGIRRGGFVADAGIEDLTPTLLYALGLPVGRDLDGQVLTGAFDPEFLAAHPLGFVPSYETLTH